MVCCRTFILLFRKDLIVARRAYIWTTIQIVLPIMFSRLSLSFFGTTPPLDANNTNSTTGLIQFEELILHGIGSCRGKTLNYAFKKNNTAMAERVDEVLMEERNETDIFKYFESIQGFNESVYNVIDQHERATMVPQKFTEVNRFDSEEEMLEKSPSGDPKEYFVFQDVTENEIRFKMTLRQKVRSDEEYENFMKVFSEERLDSGFKRFLRKPPSLCNFTSMHYDTCYELGYCVVTRLFGEAYNESKRYTILIADVCKDQNRLEFSAKAIQGIAEFITPILLFTAINRGAQKRTGIKALLHLMGLRKSTFVAEAFVFSFLKVLIVVLSILAIMFEEWPDDPKPLIVVAALLLGIIYVLIGMLCGALTRSDTGALCLCVIFLLILSYHSEYAPDVFSTSGMAYVHHLNPRISYRHIVRSTLIHMLRGKPPTFGNLFIFTDIFNAGMCLVYLMSNIIVLILLVVLFEHVPISEIASILRRRDMPELNECPVVKSWNEDVSDRDSKPAVEVTSVSKIWESTGKLAVHDFNLKAYLGDVTVLLGHNGAGKSTIYAMICGITPTTQGSIKIFGNELSTNLSECRSFMGLCPQVNCSFKYLTVDEHLWFYFKLKGGEGYWKEEADTICKRLNMERFRKRRTSKLSYGEKRKLSIAQAFIANSQLVILDEPTAGMDPQSRRDVEEFLVKEKAKRCILLSSHYMDEAEAMGDRVYIMYEGRSVCSGTPLFLKDKFASVYILCIVLTEKCTNELRSNIEEILKSYVAGSTFDEKRGNQIRFKLPKEEHRSFPGLFDELESRKEALCIDNFAVSLNSLEEVFLNVGEMTRKGAEEGADIEEGESSIQGPIIRQLQQIYYMFFKKLVFTLFSATLIIAQIVVPIALVTAIAVQLASEKKGSDMTIPDVSLDRVPNGRFLIYDPDNMTSQREIVEKYLKNFPQLEMVYFNTGVTTWPDDYPWAVAGVLLRAADEESNTTEQIVPIVPSYLNHNRLLGTILTSDLALGNGDLRTHITFRLITVKETNSFHMGNVILHTMSLFCALIACGAVFIPVKEHTCGFHIQQFLSGIHPLMYWIGTFLSDICIVLILTSVAWVILIASGFNMEDSWIVGLVALYGISLCPLFYLLSFFMKSAAIALCFCYAYNLITFSAAIRSDKFITKNGTMSVIARYVIPMLPMEILIQERLLAKSGSGKRDFTLNPAEALGAFATHGVICFFLVILLEIPLRRVLGKSCCSLPRNMDEDSPEEGPDVKEERQYVEEHSSELAMSVQNLTKYYGSKCALKGVTFGVRQSQCFGLVGAAGAGKTTAFDIVTGVSFPTDGSVTLDNRAVNGLASVGYCPQFNALLDDLSAFHNMLVIAGVVGYRNPRRKVKELLTKLEMKYHSDKRFATLSVGEKRRISIGVAMLNLSSSIVLDEPTSGLDPKARRDVWRVLSDVTKNGRTVILSSHSMEECEAICSRVGVLCRGRLVAIGDEQSLKSRYANTFVLQMALQFIKDRSQVINAVKKEFPGSILITSQQDSLHLKWQIKKKKDQLYSGVYEVVELLASTLPLKDYCLTQMSLEDVFIILNKKYNIGTAQPSDREKTMSAEVEVIDGTSKTSTPRECAEGMTDTKQHGSAEAAKDSKPYGSADALKDSKSNRGAEAEKDARRYSSAEELKDSKTSLNLKSS